MRIPLFYLLLLAGCEERYFSFPADDSAEAEDTAPLSDDPGEEGHEDTGGEDTGGEDTGGEDTGDDDDDSGDDDDDSGDDDSGDDDEEERSGDEEARLRADTDGWVIGLRS